MLSSSDALGLAAGSLLGVAFNWFGGKFMDATELQGFPRWRWMVSCAYQLAVLPAVVGLGLHTNGLTQQYLVQGWSGFRDATWERAYLYLLFGSQARDCNHYDNKLIFIHHLVVMGNCVATLFVPGGVGLFILGTAILEFGSAFFNFRVLYPQSKPLKYAYYSVMPVTNGVAMALGLYMAMNVNLNLPLKSFFVSSIVGVCIGRQRHQFKDMGWVGSKGHQE